MEYRYELTPAEFAEFSVACLRLSESGPTAVVVQRSSIAVTLVAVLATTALAAWGSLAGALCGTITAVLGAFVAAITTDTFRRWRNTPDGPVAQAIAFTDAGVVDLDRDEGPHTFPWAEVERRLDLGWAWFLEVGEDEWIVLPKRVVPPDEHAAVAARIAG